MAKNIVNWFAVLVFVGVLSACDQSQNTGEKPAEAPAAPAGGEQPAAPPATPPGQ